MLEPIAFSSKDDGRDATEGTAPTLRAMEYDQSHINGGGQLAVAFHQTQDPISGDVSPSLGATSLGMGVAYPIQDTRGIDKAQNGLGVGGPSDPSYTCDTTGVAGVAYPVARRGREDGAEWEIGEADTYNSLRAGDGGSSRQNGVITPTMQVRRLTPTECERLMGWPDGHTAQGDDGKPVSDSHRYRMCGNGVVADVAEWIGRRIYRRLRW